MLYIHDNKDIHNGLHILTGLPSSNLSLSMNSCLDIPSSDLSLSMNSCLSLVEHEHSNLDALVLNCQPISLPIFYFICITVVIILTVIGLFMAGNPIPGTEGIRTIPGSIFIPPVNYGEVIPANKMPGIYRPNGIPSHYPGVSGPSIGEAKPVEPHAKPLGPKPVYFPTKL